MLQDIFQGLLTLFFPSNCMLCHCHTLKNPLLLCQPCQDKIKANHPPFCLKCNRHLIHANPNGLCKHCLENNYAFDHAYSACLYSPPLTELIHHFKYNGKTSLKRFFGYLLLNYLTRYPLAMDHIDLIIPIPLHPTRLRERGYNQSQLLAEVISRHYNIPLNTTALMRYVNTPTQTALGAKQRWTNLKGAFKIARPSEIADKSILIVDDLFTTGATAHWASACLKEAGACYVGALHLSMAQAN